MKEKLKICYASESSNYFRPYIAFKYNGYEVGFHTEPTKEETIEMVGRILYAVENNYEITNKLNEESYDSLRKEINNEK